MVEAIRDGIFRIGVELPRNPLRELNSYVICGRGRNLLIDTGFNCPECDAILHNGLKELGVDMSRTDLFLTHLHSDHVGLANHAVEPGHPIYMNPIDAADMNYFLSDPHGWGNQALCFLADGFPPEELKVVEANNPGKRFEPSEPVDTVPVRDGDVLDVGGIKLRCIHTPGHTPGHTCLYWAEEEILFSGDHILFDITPNIAIWEDMADPLATYFASLGKIYHLPVKLCLPGHRANSTGMQGRVRALLHHHRARLAEALQLAQAQPGLSGYDAARQMTWSIRAKDWTDFPAGQKWFAVGEAMTHLACLVNLGALRKEKVNGKTAYFPAADVDLWAAILDYFEGRRKPL